MSARIFLILLSIGLLSCNGTNILSEFGSKTSDEALYFGAKMDMDDSNWTDAIAKFEQMSSAYLDKRDVQFDYAAAYAGRCGLDLLTLINEVTSSSSSSLLTILMTAQTGADDTKIADCVQAETIVSALEPTASNRTIDENLFMAFLQFAKIGSILARYADANSDDTMDVGFNACSAGSLPSGQVTPTPIYGANYLAVSIANAIAALTYAGSSIAGSQLTAINSICSTLQTAAPTYNFCAVTDPTALTADQIKGIRTLLNEGESFGLGSCSASPKSLANCVCP